MRRAGWTSDVRLSGYQVTHLFAGKGHASLACQGVALNKASQGSNLSASKLQDFKNQMAEVTSFVLDESAPCVYPGITDCGEVPALA